MEEKLQMAKIFRLFNADDCVLKLELPDSYLEEKTSYSEEEFQDIFNIFGRLLFNDLLTKDKRDFQIIQNEEGGYDYIFEVK